MSGCCFWLTSPNYFFLLHPDLIGNDVVEQNIVNGEKGDKNLTKVFKCVRIMMSMWVVRMIERIKNAG